MDYERDVLAKRATHNQMAYGERRWIRGMHLAMLFSVFLSPVWGPLLVSLAVLLHRGEEYPVTEYEAFEAVNFGLVVGAVQIPALAFGELKVFLGVNGALFLLPHIFIALATIRYCWRAFRASKNPEGLRYPDRFKLIKYNRQYFPPVNNRRRQSFRQRYGIGHRRAAR